MPKMTLNELKLVVAEMLDEAKKKKEKASETKKKGAHIEAYGLYDENFDFASPLGALSHYGRQGAVNWGPYTAASTPFDSNNLFPNQVSARREGDEAAIRQVVREVIQNGLVPAESAWAPLLEQQAPEGSSWEQASALYEAWYDKFKESGKASAKSSESGREKPKGQFERTGYGKVAKHGGAEDKKKGKK